jgi:hypothetical protein
MGNENCGGCVEMNVVAELRGGRLTKVGKLWFFLVFGGIVIKVLGSDRRFGLKLDVFDWLLTALNCF